MRSSERPTRQIHIIIPLSSGCFGSAPLSGAARSSTRLGRGLLHSTRGGACQGLVAAASRAGRTAVSPYISVGLCDASWELALAEVSVE